MTQRNFTVDTGITINGTDGNIDLPAGESSIQTPDQTGTISLKVQGGNTEQSLLALGSDGGEDQYVYISSINGTGNRVSLDMGSYVGSAPYAKIQTYDGVSVQNDWTFTSAPLDPTEALFSVPPGATISTPDATGNITGKNIFIVAGSADQSDFYTTAGGELILQGGRGASNNGGGGGPGGNVNINAGDSADPAGRAGNVNINAGALTNWVFDYTGNLTLPTNGSIIVDGGDGVIGPVSDDLVISWDNEDLRLVSLNDSIIMQSDTAFRVQANYDGANVLYASRWEFNQNEIVNISNDFGIVSEVGDLNLSGGRDGVNSGNTTISAVATGVAVNTWTFDNTGNLVLPGNTFAVNYANGTAVSLGGAGSYGDSNVVSLMSAFGSNTISTTGNITAGNFIGNIQLVGNVQGTQANVTLIAGSYSYTFDNTGVASFPAVGGDEGGEINFAIPTANTTLTGPVKVDVYRNQLRFFDGSIKGAYLDLANCPSGVSTAIGYRDIPQISFSANATATGNAAGCHYYSTTAGNLQLTIPDNANVAFPTGATLTIVMNAAGNVIVAQGTGVSLYMAGSSTTGNRTVGAYGLASVMKVATNTWVISGTGVY